MAPSMRAMALADARPLAAGAVALRSPLRLLVLLSLCSGTSALEMTIVSDGSYRKPFCSWSRSCTWDDSVQQVCAEKMCKAAGFETGKYISSSNSMCEKSFTSYYAWYYLVDKAKYYSGRANLEAQITASCSSTAMTEAPTEPTTAEPGEDGVNSETTVPTTVAPTIPATSTDTSTTVTATSTTKTTTTVTTTTVTTKTPTSTSTSGITTTITGPTTTRTSSTKTTTTTTTSSATTSSATTTLTTTPPVALTNRIEGRIVVTSIATPEQFCSSPLGSSYVTKVVAEHSGLIGRPGVEYIGACLSQWSRRLSSRNLGDSIEIKYEIWTTTDETVITTEHLAAIEAVDITTLKDAINTRLGPYFASMFEITGVLSSTVFEQGVTSSTRTETTSTSSTRTFTTTTATTTTVLAFCEGAPVVQNGGDMSHCIDIPNGGTCEPVCLEGYAMEQTITCENGQFNIPGSCISVAAKTTTTKAIQITLSLGAIFSDLGGSNDGSTPPLSLSWAKNNRGTILNSVAATLGLPPGRVLIEFVLVIRRKRRGGGGTDGNLRRLEEISRNLQDEETEEVLEMRVTVLADEATTTEELAAMSEQYQETLVSGDPSNTGGTATSATTATDANGKPVRGFMATLATQMEAAGTPMPSGMAVEATGPPAVIAQFVVAISEWLSGDWDACSAVCGTGQRKRKVECSSGYDDQCLSLGERPQDEDECSDYTSCAAGVTCPMGPESMDCTTQAGITLGGASAIGCLCLMAFCRKLQVASRPHKGGTVTLKDTGFGNKSALRSSYQIYRPEDRKSTARSSSIFRFSTKSNVNVDTTSAADLEVGEETADGKTHVVWDTDRQSLKEMFADRGTQLSMTSKQSKQSLDSQGRPGLPRVASASLKNGGASPSSWDGAYVEGFGDVPSDGAVVDDFKAADSDDELEVRLEEIAAFVEDFGDQFVESGENGNPWASPEHDNNRSSANRIIGANGREMFPVYHEGEHVEYFSATLNRWLGATVHIKTNPTTSTIRYDANITATRQHRADVPLEDLRRPLRKNEAVEVYSRRKGAWTPAVISPNQLTGSTNFGVELEFMGAAGQVDKVPAAKVRRRYVEGQTVKVYRGCYPGWVSAKVEAVQEPASNGDEDAEEVDSPTLRAEIIGRQQRRLKSMATMASQDSAVRDLPTCANKMSVCTDASRTSPGSRWCLVCVNFEEEDSDKVDREWFPTYLVR
mmetsp:Transcript_118677/g.343242  ORF Transcript_118677/g.343242 Transcript_118677/m.343242 type:complete len:1209 (-) Transcript_118677:133-3759(-)